MRGCPPSAPLPAVHVLRVDFSIELKTCHPADKVPGCHLLLFEIPLGLITKLGTEMAFPKDIHLVPHLPEIGLHRRGGANPYPDCLSSPPPLKNYRGDLP